MKTLYKTLLFFVFISFVLFYFSVLYYITLNEEKNLGGGITETTSLTAEVDKIKQLQADYAKDNSGKYFNTEKASISEKKEIAEFKSKLDEYQAPCGNGYTITLEKQEKDGLYQKVINEGCEKYREQDWELFIKDL